MTERRVIRRLFPKRTKCPECGHENYRPNGSSRGGLLVYRRCAKCLHTYRVASIGQEEDRGGLTSILVLW